MNKYLLIATGVLFAVLLFGLWYSRGEVKTLKLEKEILTQNLESATGANAKNDEIISRLTLDYEARINEFANALKRENEAHNETKKLINVLERKRDIKSDKILTETCLIINDKNDIILQGLKDR
jgi:hypothetical protein